jgi:plasmid stabilization system protein ParE
MSTSGTKRLEWKPRALWEISDSFEFIAAEDPQAAWRILERIQDMAHMLATQPFMGRKGARGEPGNSPSPVPPFF